MKKITFYIMLIGAVVLSSCSDFLDSEPLTGLTEGTFYKTKADAEKAIIGCYDGVQALYSSGVGLPVLSEVIGDDCFGGTGYNDAYNYQVLDHFDINQSAGEVDILNSDWQAYYKAIYRTNMLLGKMGEIDWEGDTTYMNVIEAQTRFLRAYCYFDMARIWEKVPLITVPTLENVAPASADEIYAVIASDLKFAAEYGSSTVEAGRVNKFAAKALLARVYLFYTGYYGKTDLAGITKAEVLAGLEEVIAESSYGLLEEFKNLWPAASTVVNEAGDGVETTYAGKDNMETIFAIKYNITSDYNGNTDGNHWMVMMGLRALGFNPPYGKGWGACTVRPEFYASFEEGDERKSASIIAIQNEGLEFDNSDQRDYTGYTIKKYTPMAGPYTNEEGVVVIDDFSIAGGGTNFMIGQYQDYVVMRYADVLLMAAELGSANAQDYFDQVRDRAGLESKTVSTANIMKERHFEFAFEGIRYWDLLRQGVDVAAEAIATSTTVENGGVATSKVILASKIKATRGFQQVPQQQITATGGVVSQNAGW